MNSQLLVLSQGTEYWTFGVIVKISNVLSADKRVSSSFIVIFSVGVCSKLDDGKTPSGELSKLKLLNHSITAETDLPCTLFPGESLRCTAVLDRGSREFSTLFKMLCVRRSITTSSSVSGPGNSGGFDPPTLIDCRDSRVASNASSFSSAATRRRWSLLPATVPFNRRLYNFR